MAAFSHPLKPEAPLGIYGSSLHQAFNRLKLLRHCGLKGHVVSGNHQSMQRASPQLHPHQVAGLQSKRCIGAVGEGPALTPSLKPDLNEIRRLFGGVAKA